jgi:hypothetical protein
MKILIFSPFITGKVVIDAFRLINPNMMVLGQEPRQTTSNLGHLQKPSVQVIFLYLFKLQPEECHFSHLNNSGNFFNKQFLKFSIHRRLL